MDWLCVKRWQAGEWDLLGCFGLSLLSLGVLLACLGVNGFKAVRVAGHRNTESRFVYAGEGLGFHETIDGVELYGSFRKDLPRRWYLSHTAATTGPPISGGGVSTVRVVWDCPKGFEWLVVSGARICGDRCIFTRPGTALLGQGDLDRIPRVLNNWLFRHRIQACRSMRLGPLQVAILWCT